MIRRVCLSGLIKTSYEVLEIFSSPLFTTSVGGFRNVTKFAAKRPPTREVNPNLHHILLNHLLLFFGRSEFSTKNCVFFSHPIFAITGCHKYDVWRLKTIPGVAHMTLYSSLYP
ncbi:uncharacterized protein YALI1_F16199g [Yarrowia lipolytica]|uniref:Uncharacterized protein n=1 Tax=Yarrowia lipolytica TaxID=4952 RepID=A0A1D8NN29_YARLL|nr:hypothetical protein YALI1_F16199g [Yarrowia lipolytica]